MPTAELNKVERAAHALGRFANVSAMGKAAQGAFLRNISLRWVRRALRYRLLAHGVEKLRDVTPERGALLVSNHRSFFDQYAILCTMISRGVPWVGDMFFPVRSNFFYDHPAGMLINFMVAGGAMYPPVYREAERRALNDDALDQIVALLQRPGVIVGMHPEGTRGKGPDPYELLPAQPGVGKMALAAKPTVVPMFINGLSNDFVGDLRLGFSGQARVERPVIIAFGEPIDYSAFLQEKPRPTLYKRCADLFMAEIKKLSLVEKELRADCAERRITDDDPRWLSNPGL